MLVKTIKISKKGQITLPKEIRKALGTEVLKVTLQGRQVILEPLEDLAGALKEYARPVNLDQAKEEAWTEVVREKYGRSRH
ncbi:MAG TPA: AbrB/MazE/SpoVT family DNA-binding domain-containing protein [Thermodesulfatator atlanticus]|uniref:AbrB/MazE/SpoVT family DNA-binding domain-containing protein n=1 Tax=Thermodesulfatator atlanticus TaxID=501497 RepID=A0A7V5U354_9BACT|nr:AbrB/MazE/SpoVT family DNA-binding domain-containing protein [Thermodesulfatator atlanticus]